MGMDLGVFIGAVLDVPDIWMPLQSWHLGFSVSRTVLGMAWRFGALHLGAYSDGAAKVE